MSRKALLVRVGACGVGAVLALGAYFLIRSGCEFPKPFGEKATRTHGDPFRASGLLPPDQPIATFGDQKILSRDFYNLLIREYGQEILAQQIQDMVVEQEATKRGIVIPDAEIEPHIAQIRRELKQDPGGHRTLEEILVEKKMTLDQFKREYKRQVALERMVRHDLRLPETSPVRDEEIHRWITGLIKKAKIRGWRDGLPPGIVAVVNGEELPEVSILKELADRVDRSEIEKILDRLLDERIVEKLMQERKIDIKETDLDKATENAVNVFRKKSGLASATVENYLQATGKTLAQVRAQFRVDLGLRRLVAQEVTEEQLRAAFQENLDAYNGKLVHAQHILAAAVDLKTMEPLDARAFDRAKVKIENILQRLKSGGNFEEIARKESDDPGTAPKGGDLGFIKRFGDVAEEVAAMAFLLKPGEISPPVRSKYGFHLVRVVEIKPGRPVRFEDVRGDVLANVVAATCNAWLQNYKRSLSITKNLGQMGRPAPGSEPRR